MAEAVRAEELRSFSDIAHPTPFWLAGQRYDTLAHWIFAHRSGPEHSKEIIRQPDGEAAVRFGSFLAARAGWEHEWVSVVYVALLAKLRQYPQFAELYDNERSFVDEFERGCRDVLEGMDRGLLRTLLAFVYGQLEVQTHVPTGRLKGFLDPRVLRYDFGAGARQLRSGGEAWLVHLIKEQQAGQAEKVLQHIHDAGLLKASKLLNGHRAVCFSGLPTRDLDMRVFGSEAEARTALNLYRYSAFGIALRFDSARHFGVQPVIPCHPTDTGAFPNTSKPLTQIYSPPYFDYTHEDEWRYPGDVQLSEIPFAVVRPNTEGDGLAFHPAWRI